MATRLPHNKKIDVKEIKLLVEPLSYEPVRTAISADSNNHPCFQPNNLATHKLCRPRRSSR